MLHLILFGPPGSGKGTQAVMIAEKYQLVHISTGDLFRYETSQKTELGLKALEYMSQGMLVPDHITIKMLQNKVNSLPDVKGFIYDGFPRTIAQAEALDEMLSGRNENIGILLSLEVPEDEIIKRILKRGLSSGRPDDNDESIIRTRIQVYLKETAAVFNHYTDSGISKRVNGIGTIEEIFIRLCNHINPLC